jgi:hypothetical protein
VEANLQKGNNSVHSLSGMHVSVNIKKRKIPFSYILVTGWDLSLSHWLCSGREVLLFFIL